MTPLRSSSRPAFAPWRLGAVVALLSLVSSPLVAQSRGGDVSGTITSASTHAPIAGARVGTTTPSRAAIADERGVYLLRNLPAGRYEIVVTALGRTPARDSVTVTASGVTRHDVALRSGSLMLSSVIVSATRTPTVASQVAWFLKHGHFSRDAEPSLDLATRNTRQADSP